MIDLKKIDPQIAAAIEDELKRQRNCVELIASENFASPAVMAAQGSIMTNKYAEGYPGKRYYCGCEEVDKVENLAIKRITELFSCNYANVQPHSGSQANQAVYIALLNPGDKILGMSLSSGGHLTHGASVNFSGKWLSSIAYEVDPESYLIDYDQIEKLALEHKPKLIICGFSCYSRPIDFARFREIADKVSAYLLADVAHIAGLIATGMHSSPFPHCHVVTSTTHKTLRGPRGGIILTNDEEIANKVNKALFPGMQGGPLMHVIAAKAVAFGEALEPEFKEYIKQTIANAKTFAKVLIERGYKVLTGGTENHIVALDLTGCIKLSSSLEVSGKEASEALESVGITSNKNSIPFDKKSPFVTSGVRFGTPACTTRGFLEEDFTELANIVADVIDALVKENFDDMAKKSAQENVARLLGRFPLYQDWL